MTHTLMPMQMTEAPRQLRCWVVDDASALLDAIASPQSDLARWLRWPARQPLTIEGQRASIRRWRARFRRGVSFHFALTMHDELLGGAIVMPRIGAGAVELGYWLRGECRGRGHAAAAVAMLARHCFLALRVRRIEIHCDPANQPSMAVARRAGFAPLTTINARIISPSSPPRDTTIWALAAPAS